MNKFSSKCQSKPPHLKMTESLKNKIRFDAVRDFLYEKKVTKETFEIVTHDSIPNAQPVNFDTSIMINNIKTEIFASKLKTLLIESVQIAHRGRFRAITHAEQEHSLLYCAMGTKFQRCANG
jgi:hypothetical protein